MNERISTWALTLMQIRDLPECTWMPVHLLDYKKYIYERPYDWTTDGE